MKKCVPLHQKVEGAASAQHHSKRRPAKRNASAAETQALREVDFNIAANFQYV